MYALISAFLCSLIASLLIIRYQNVHKHITGDTDLSGPQKFHLSSVPRIGGLSIYLALCFASLVRFIQDPVSGSLLLLITACGSIAFLVGFAEDISKRVGITARLLGTAISGGVASYLLDAWISHISLWGIDTLLAIPAISILFTCIAIAGLSNAYNIIDGFNGLASMVGIITLLAIASVAFRVGDIAILIAALMMVGAIGGFFVWNYPRGLIFLGDGGAYLIGFWIGVLSILIVSRNEQVSPWFALLVNAYPIFETLFSIWRRKVHQGKNPGMPDGAHFHTLIYRRIMRWALASNAEAESNTQSVVSENANAKTSPYLWVLSSFAVLPAVLFWQQTIILQGFALLFCVTYVWIYRSIVKFQTPRWLK
jgi:UDP-N-acetylmuramyl pentapeptide phosphotransferase/UDP-N-acetylglucosamine-1-phosphate transferase